MDRLSKKRRSALMSRIRSKNTGPERAVRGLVHRLGHRFRLHRKDLPGTPDLTFVSARKVIFVNGCFWHGHKCKVQKMPKSRTEYWIPKISENRKRDLRKLGQLRRRGWNSLVVWECETKLLDRLALKLVRFLGARRSTSKKY